MDPATGTGAVFSAAKLWTIASSVCGSVVPILALSDNKKISLRNAIFMAATGSSFSIFVGPWLGVKLGMISLEAISALSWGLGAFGVYLIRTVLTWLDQKGVGALDKVISKAAGIEQEKPPSAP